MIMGGWKTWLAAGLVAGLSVLFLINGETELGMQQIVAALGLVGIGHKIEKAR